MSAPAPRGKAYVRAACYNVLAHEHTHHNKAAHGGAEKESVKQRNDRRLRVAAAILALEADVVLVQEWDLDMPPPLGWEIASLSTGRPGATEGVAVLMPTRRPELVGAARARLRHDSGKASAILVTRKCVFVSVHLPGGPKSDGAKAAQLRDVKAWVEANAPGLPVVLGGDTNCASPATVLGPVLAPAGLALCPYADAAVR